MKNFLSTAMLAVLLVMASACTSKAQSKSGVEATPEEDSAEYTLSILVAGDLMQHQGQINAARNSDGTYSYDETFRYVKEEVSSADLAIANFEVTALQGLSVFLCSRRIPAGDYRCGLRRAADGQQPLS